MQYDCKHICACRHQSVGKSICRSVCQPACLSVSLPVRRSVCRQSVCRQSVCRQSVRQSITPSFIQSVSQSVCRSVCLTVCLSVTWPVTWPVSRSRLSVDESVCLSARHQSVYQSVSLSRPATDCHGLPRTATLRESLSPNLT